MGTKETTDRGNKAGNQIRGRWNRMAGALARRKEDQSSSWKLLFTSKVWKQSSFRANFYFEGLSGIACQRLKHTHSPRAYILSLDILS